jgi:hypothetical protein
MTRSNDLSLPRDQDRRRRVRRNTWLLAAVAAAFYVAFIALSIGSRHA